MARYTFGPIALPGLPAGETLPVRTSILGTEVPVVPLPGTVEAPVVSASGSIPQFQGPEGARNVLVKLPSGEWLLIESVETASPPPKPTTGELAYAENVTGVVTAFDYDTPADIPGTSITVPVSVGPVYLRFQAGLEQTAAGAGLIVLGVYEGATRIAEAVRPAADSTGAGSRFSTISGLVRLGTVTVERTLHLRASCTPDTLSMPAFQVLNSAARATSLAARR